MTHFSHLFGKLAHRFAHTLAIIFCILSLAFVLILATGHLVLARMAGQLGPVIQRELERTLGRSVRIGAVQLDGIRTLSITDIALAKSSSFTDGAALEIPRTLARVNLLSLLLHPGDNPVMAIDRIVLRGPAMTVLRDAQGRFDFQDVIDRLRKRQSSDSLRARVVVEDAKVRYRDARGFGETPRAMDQHFTMVHAVFMPQDDEGIAFTARGADAGHLVQGISLAGSYTPKAGQAQVRVAAKQIDVRALADYLPKKLPITVEDGTAALRLTALLTNLPTPEAAHASPTTALTAEVDLRGVGLRLDELTTPIVAHSGRLRLVHDAQRYPHGSRLELIDVQATANAIPIELSGQISEINLFDLAHVNPLFNMYARLTTGDGEAISRLFPTNEWAHALVLDGPVTLDSRIYGRPADLRIDGTLQTRHFAVRGLTAEDVRATFTLTPAQVTTLRATATVARMSTATGSLDALNLQLSSTTPWRQLEKSPVLTGAAAAEGVILPWATLADVQGRLVATGDGVTVTQMHAGLFGGQAVANVTFPFAMREGRTRADADFTGVDLAQFAKAFNVSDLAGHADGRLRLTLGPDGSLSADARVTSTDAAFRGYAATQADADLQIASDRDGLRVSIPRATATTGYGTFTATNGLITRQGVAPSVITMTLRGKAIPLAQFGDPAEYAGLATLEGTVSGGPLSPTLAATVTAADGKLAGYDFATGRAEMRYQNDGALRFYNVALARPGMDVTLTVGTEGFDPRDGLAGQDATLRLHGATLHEALALFDAECPVRMDGGIQGTVQLHVGEDGVTATGDAAIADATVHIPQEDDTYPLDLRRIALAFDYADRAVTVRSLRLERGETAITATGSATCPPGDSLAVDLAYRTDGAEIGDIPHQLIGLPLTLTGPVDARGTLHGALDGNGASPLVLTVAATSPSTAAAGVPLGAGEAALTYSYRLDDKQLAVDHVTFANAAFTARGSGRYFASRRVMEAVAVDVSPIRLSTLAALLRSTDSGFAVNLPEGLDGTVAVRVRADGAAGRPSLRLETTGADATYAGKPLPNLRAALVGARVGDDYQVRLEDAALTDRHGTTLARAGGLLLGDGAPNVAFSADGLTPAMLAPWIDAEKIGGIAEVRGTLRGSWQQPVVESDIAVTNPAWDGRAVPRATGHLRVTRTEANLTQGRIVLRAGAPPMAMAGSLPLRWHGQTPRIVADAPFALSMSLPQQDMAPLRALVPALTALTGTIEGALRVDGTPAQPVLHTGTLRIAGAVGLPNTAAGNPNRIDDIDVRLSATGDRRGVTVQVEQIAATLTRRDGGKPAKDFLPGWIVAEGDVRIPGTAWGNPRRWEWDIYATAARLPLDASLFMVPQASGYLHLGSAADGPVLNGVLMVSGTKIRKPKMAAGTVPHWGPYPFNPRLDVLIQVGQYVKLSSGMFRIPLRPTPLELPAVPNGPGLTIDRALPAYVATARQTRAETAGEMTGTWGAITGSVNEPAIYARFEVEKARLSFPLNLFGAIRHARGHVTYSRADGPRIVMGIPEFPAETASAAPATQ